MKFFLLFTSLFFSSVLFAQDSTIANITDAGSVIIHKDPRIDSLIKKQAEYNEAIFRNTKKMIKGFRILVVNTYKRDEAVDAKAKLYTYFPELKPYLTYKSPYFRLKAGNFIDRKDAEDYQKKINKYFPKGVFIVNDIIEVKPEAITTDLISQ